MGGKNPPALAGNLDNLRRVGAAELRTRYFELLQCNAPPSMSPEFLHGHIAWALQAQQRGQVPKRLRKQLLRAIERSPLTLRQSMLPPGSRLVREWKGKTYEVTRLENGYAWQGRTYRSLTRIATEITGTKWSGPRFFGLKVVSGD